MHTGLTFCIILLSMWKIDVQKIEIYFPILFGWAFVAAYSKSRNFFFCFKKSTAALWEIMKLFYPAAVFK